MSTQAPSTPIKVSAAAASYTPATQDQDLRSQINGLLIKEGHVSKIQDSLLHALHSHQSNWPTVIQTHALSLLRSGEVTSFPALLRRVLEDVRQDTALAPSGGSTNGNSKGVNGASEENGTSVNGKKSDATNGANGASAKQSLAVPQNVVDDALKVTRDCLESVIDIDENVAA
ncbi:hypothetical protein B0J18DRAFT_410182 [Chaetomium sp. MPI-SDFR-AT-0129]|uniref:Uncharacterized protein n=1 Tax=Dichotomopilus funicola TaxID=1934379 RepID=A0AAN6V798_9PEZI|nr:hypothetical protein B0J18DRAFT_410182 [Chaetomium sp. MPI-SDFR-AT-0129]KAK4146178.1 hypothetical protein C8A04DRAFT_10002 [Dichotomopilus funicola]